MGQKDWVVQPEMAESWGRLNPACGLRTEVSNLVQTHLSKGQSEYDPPERPIHLPSSFLATLPKQIWLAASTSSLPSTPQSNKRRNVTPGKELGSHLPYHLWSRKSASPLECVENVDSLASPRPPKLECQGREHGICIINKLFRAFWWFTED